MPTPQSSSPEENNDKKNSPFAVRVMPRSPEAAEDTRDPRLIPPSQRKGEVTSETPSPNWKTLQQETPQAASPNFHPEVPPAETAPTGKVSETTVPQTPVPDAAPIQETSRKASTSGASLAELRAKIAGSGSTPPVEPAIPQTGGGAFGMADAVHAPEATHDTPATMPKAATAPSGTPVGAVELPNTSMVGTPPSPHTAPQTESAAMPTTSTPDSPIAASLHPEAAGASPAAAPASAPTAETSAAIPASPNTQGAHVPTIAVRSANTSVVRPIRTFRDDISQVVERRKISLVSAIAAEQDRRAEEPKKEKPQLSRRSYFALGLSTAFVILGMVALGGYLTYDRYFKVASVLPDDQVPGFFVTEAQYALDVTGMDRAALMDTLVNTRDRVNVRLGAMVQYYPVEMVAGEDGSSKASLVSLQRLLRILESEAPSALLRALAPEMMLGFHQFDGNDPFLIMRVADYDNAFAGMLEWEDTLNRELAPLFGPVAYREVPRAPESSAGTVSTSTARAASSTPDTAPVPSGTATSSATTTPQQARPSSTFVPLVFEDDIIRNKEVRVLRNDAGEIILLYSFIDPSTIVITTTTATFEEILSRFATRRI